MNTIIRIYFVAAVVFGMAGAAVGQAGNQVQYNIASGSRVWFEGTSTLHPFSATSKSVFGTVVIRSSSAELSPGADSVCQANVTLPVRTLDSGEKGLNDNMYKAMKADEFSDIEYKLSSANVDPAADTVKGALALQTTGALTISGVRKEIGMGARFFVNPEGKLELTGSESLLMTDFGIKPPTMMFGVIKTGDKVMVHFDLILAPPQNGTLSAR